ncbi:MFS transporter [Cohnella suwonensis]|uniref:MFS transporter n=1 Tax=Cohnella suwonensis TaxID=696072 RepID=A0ABW0LZ22_9BACL
MKSVNPIVPSEDGSRIYKRSLTIVVLSQIFGGAGLAAGITVGGLLAQEMIGSEGYAGAPSALFTLGSAASAFLVGRLSQRYGRRIGLSAGFMAGGAGALGVIAAAVTDQLFLLFLSLLIYGAGMATNLQARYAGTDLAKPTQRARAISTAMVSTTLGAVAGPNLVDPMGRIAESMDVPALAGPFILAAAAYLLAGATLFVFLRPDPLLVARSIASEQAGNAVKAPGPFERERAANGRGLFVGASVMVLTQLVMAAIMTMTPVHMKHHGHGLGDVGLVIGIHIGAMYLPSLATGMFADKFGRTVTACSSGFILLSAGMLAAWAPADSMPLLVVALALLGLGWNLGFISGTAIIVDATSLENRARMQGSLDVTIALAGATGGALSGMVVAASSFSTLSWIGGVLSLLLIPIIVWARDNNNKQSSEA